MRKANRDTSMFQQQRNSPHYHLQLPPYSEHQGRQHNQFQYDNTSPVLDRRSSPIPYKFNKRRLFLLWYWIPLSLFEIEEGFDELRT